MEDKTTLDASFWDERWRTGQTGWDMGQASPPLTEFMDSYSNKDAVILIPGCGNAYEAEYLANNGFTNITVLDISPEAVKRLKEKFKDYSQIEVVNMNFFEHKGEYDVILEQTFFCALNPALRSDYVQKMHSLLKPNGILAGVMFNKEFEHQGPPFGGSQDEYRGLFEKKFTIEKMEECYNSITPRAGSELFVKFRKK